MLDCPPDVPLEKLHEVERSEDFEPCPPLQLGILAWQLKSQRHPFSQGNLSRFVVGRYDIGRSVFYLDEEEEPWKTLKALGGFKC